MVLDLLVLKYSPQRNSSRNFQTTDRLKLPKAITLLYGSYLGSKMLWENIVHSVIRDLANGY